MPEVAAIILAAGQSRRMGARNKLLLPIAGVPMIRHVVDVYRQVARVLVVTGHAADDIAAALGQSDVTLAFNPDHLQGQQTSVACGLRTAVKAEVLLIGLGAQPLLTPDDLRALLAAHAAADPGRISIPRRGDRRGNPIAVPDPLRAGLLADPHAPGCKRFTRDNPDLVQFHPLAASGFYTDIDTPDAYAAFTARAQELAP